MGLRHFLFLFILLATLVHGWWMFAAYWRQREVMEAMSGMRRLAALVIQDYPDRNPPVDGGGAGFWKGLGRTGPILDPWGSAFRLERREVPGSAPLFVWGSAGPDGQWNTVDDLEVVVPYL